MLFNIQPFLILADDTNLFHSNKSLKQLTKKGESRLKSTKQLAKCK